MAPGEGYVEAGLIRELCSADVFVFVGRVKVIMKIAQVAPLIESVPPRLYGGTERIVSYLTEELVRLGHDVTLFASGDSITTAEPSWLPVVIVRCASMLPCATAFRTLC